MRRDNEISRVSVVGRWLVSIRRKLRHSLQSSAYCQSLLRYSTAVCPLQRDSRFSYCTLLSFLVLSQLYQSVQQSREFALASLVELASSAYW